MSSNATFGWSAGVVIGGITLTTLVCQFAGNAAPLPESTTHETHYVRRGVIQAPPPEYMAEIRHGLAACFSRDGLPTQAAMDDVNSMYFVWDRYNASTRWSTTASGSAGSQGDAATLLWSLVPDTVSIPSAISGEATSNSQLFSRMDTLFAGVGGRAVWVQQFIRVFARWQSLSGVNYSRVTVGGNDWDDGAVWSSSGAIGLRGDIRISMHPIDGVNGILAYNQFPGAGSGGNMVIDSSENWVSGSTGSTPFRFFRNTVAHEHGHGLGFSHVCPSNGTKLMEPFLSTSFDGPQQDDIRAVQRQYGDPFEPNNSVPTAAFLGTLGTSSGIGLGTTPTTVAGDTIVYPNVANAALLSIDANSEVDYWQFDTTANILATIVVTPIGSSYSDLNQDGSGSDGCTGGTGGTTNALAACNPVITLVNGPGSAGLALVDANAAGLSETLPTFLLSGSSTYNLKVSESDAPTESQLYKFTITVNGPTSVTASDAASSNTITLSWTNIPGATQYQVYRGTTTDFAAAAQIATPATNSFNDTGRPASTTYFYWVKATQTNGGFSSNQFVGGPEQGSTGVAPNTPPTANAGPDQTLRDTAGVGSLTVALSGSLSSDSDGTIGNYKWAEGVTTLANGASPTANVSLATGVHTITLTVTDNAAATGSDTVVVTITSNIAPVASAGPDQSVTDADNSGGELIGLSAVGSNDSDGTISSYIWSESVTQIASGLSPSILFSVGIHTVTLTVTDNEGRTGTDTVVITVTAPPSCPADFNDDTSVDFFDYDDFVTCFEGGVCPPGKTADFNNDTSVDFFDYDEFVQAFELGCG